MPPSRYARHYRIGARCRDGWRSHATRSGACSWHGGVAEWLYADDLFRVPSRMRRLRPSDSLGVLLNYDSG